MTDDASNEHRLPEDVQRWPTDPAQLLGVSPEASRRDVKRAYTRLIKLYKPEHAPEEFRRLRSAFEELDRQLEWREIYQLRSRPATESEDENSAEPAVHDEVDSETSLPGDEPAGSSESNRQTAADETEEPRRPRTSRDHGLITPDQLWQQALDDGDLGIVYSGLQRWLRERIPSEVDFARLYWLLTLASDLDPERDPCSWLIAGLQKHGSSGRLLEMLEVEVRRRDGQVPQLLAAEILKIPFPAAMLVSMADLRWYAARRQDRLDVIAQDFEVLKRRFLDEASEWLRLLSIALHHVLLTDAADFMNQIREELSHLSSTSSQDWVWDSIEAELPLHEAWLAAPEQWERQPYSTPPLLKEVVQLVEATWESSVIESRTAVLKICVLLSDGPTARLNELMKLGQSRPLLMRLRVLLDQQLAMKGLYRTNELTPGLDEELQRFIRKYFVQSESRDFNENVLNFCLREAVTPYDIAAALERIPVSVPEQYYVTAEEITKNLALHCVVQAHRMLW